MEHLRFRCGDGGRRIGLNVSLVVALRDAESPAFCESDGRQALVLNEVPDSAGTDR